MQKQAVLWIFGVLLSAAVAAATDPAQVFVQGQAILRGRANNDAITPDLATGTLNVTLNISSGVIAAVQPPMPLTFVLYRTPDFAEDSVLGAQRVCSYTDQNADDQVCASQIANNRLYESVDFSDACIVTIRNMTLPASADAFRLVTFQYNFKDLTFSIADPPGSTLQAYSSDVENYNSQVLYSFAPRAQTVVPVFWTAYVKAKHRRNAKLTVFHPNLANSSAAYWFRTTTLDLSNFPASATASSVYSNSFTFPCPGAGNETFGSDCATCDSTRFHNTTAATGLPKTCGKCVTGRFGHFCQYTDATKCQIGDCGGFGTCVPESRECSCMATSFAHTASANPTAFRFGDHCEMDHATCATSKCQGRGVCDPVTRVQDPNFSYMFTYTYNFSSVTCKCGSVTENSYTQDVGKTFGSYCMNCTTGYISGKTCSQCAPGYYGATCQYTNATACAVANTALASCGGRGDCQYVTTPGNAPPCNCTTPGSGLFKCDLAPCVSGNPVSFQDAPGLPFRWYCNYTYMIDWVSFVGTLDDARWRGLDLAKGAYVCSENYAFVQHTSGARYGKETCVGCRPGWWGAFCNITSEAGCRASACGGHGSCVELYNPGRSFKDFQCQCDAGFSGYDCLLPASNSSALYCNSNGVANMHFDTYGGLLSVDCSCASGHFGPACNLTSSQCAAVHCFSPNHTTCPPNIATAGGYCTCDTGYSGNDCSLGDANVTQCSGHGAYTVTWDRSWKCDCDPGYFGTTCLFDATQCRSGFCTGNGACAQNGSELTLWTISAATASSRVVPNCICDAGFTGHFCELSLAPFTLVDPVSINITIANPIYDLTLVNSSLANTTLPDFGSGSNSTVVTTADSIVASAYTAGVYFVYTPIITTASSASLHMQSSGLGVVFRRLVDHTQHTGAFATQTTSGSTIIVTCAQGAVVGPFSSGLNRTIASGNIICVDVGVTPGCVNQSGPGYINASLFTVVDASSGAIKTCPALTILDAASGKTITIVDLIHDTTALVAKMPYSPTAPTANLTSRGCTVTLLSFMSPAADRYYVVGRNCSSSLDPLTGTALFIDVFAVNATATVSDTVDLHYVTTQLVSNPFAPYVSDRVLWAPKSRRLLVRHPMTGWNLIPLNPSTGLFETGFVVAQVLPGSSFDPWLDVVLYDSGDTLAFVTFGTSGSLTTAYPIVVNVTQFTSGFVSSAIRYLHSSLNGFQPTILSDIYSASQIHVSYPQELISLVMIGGRVLLAVEKIVDQVQPATPAQYIGLMCVLAGGATIRSPNAQLCTDFNTQLDTGLLISATATNSLVANPYLSGIQSIAVMPFTQDSTNLPMVVAFVRTTGVSTFSISVSNSSVISSKLIQDISAAQIDPSITNCTFGQFSPDGAVFTLVCEHVLAYFSVDSRSFFMSYSTKHITPSATGKVCSSSATGRIYAVNANITATTVFSPFVVGVPQRNTTATTAGTATAASSSSNYAAIGGGLAAAFVVMIIVGALLYCCSGPKRPSRQGAVELPQREPQ